jgi:hypothetical protein
MIIQQNIAQSFHSPIVLLLLAAIACGLLYVLWREVRKIPAKLFTLTKTCNRHRIDPFAYLQDVYARLPTTPPDELPSLLPDRWIQDHPQHLIQERVQEALDRAQRARERRAERRRRAAA